MALTVRKFNNSRCFTVVERKGGPYSRHLVAVATRIEKESDANLFAGSPEMYNALKMARERIDPSDTKVLRAIDIALAKVEGRITWQP